MPVMGFAEGTTISMDKLNANNSIDTNISNNSGLFPCPSCGFMLSIGSKFCNQCGSKIEEPSRLVCPKCGIMAEEEDSVYCIHCGTRLME